MIYYQKVRQKREVKDYITKGIGQMFLSEKTYPNNKHTASSGKSLTLWPASPILNK